MKENEPFIEVEVWDGDEFYAAASGPKDYVVREVKHYAHLLTTQGSVDVNFEQVLRYPITLEELAGEVNEG